MRRIWLAGLALSGLCGIAAAAPYDTGGSNHVRTMLMRASTMIDNGRDTAAFAKLAAAIRIEPTFALLYARRAEWEINAGLYTKAEADLATFATYHPRSRGLWFLRSLSALDQGNGAAALTDLAMVASLPDTVHDPDFMEIYGQWSNALYHANKSIAEALLHQDDATLADLKAAVDTEAMNTGPILNHYCYTAAVAGLLDLAELTCQEAIKTQWSNGWEAYDSLAFVELRKHAWQQAIAAYDKSLARNDSLTLSLYGRGVARVASGDAGGNNDIARARRIEPDINGIMGRLGAPTLASISTAAPSQAATHH